MRGRVDTDQKDRGKRLTGKIIVAKVRHRQWLCCGDVTPKVRADASAKP